MKGGVLGRENWGAGGPSYGERWVVPAHAAVAGRWSKRYTLAPEDEIPTRRTFGKMTSVPISSPEQATAGPHCRRLPQDGHRSLRSRREQV